MTNDLDVWLADFVRAHERDFQSALREIETGRKQSHWMWYVFPQLMREGATGTAARYAVPTLEHAIAFLQHPVLGSNYLAITCEACHQLEASIGSQKLLALFRHPDHLKFVSSVTLMGEAARRAKLGEIAEACEMGLALAYADGMAGCALTKKFLEN